MQENQIYLILDIEAIGIIIILIGFLTSKNLPKKHKKFRIQKFAAIAFALIAFSFGLLRPFVSSYSYSNHADELKAKNLNSIEDIARFEQEQSRQIEALKDDIKDLRADLYSVNRSYGFLITMLSTGVGTVCVIFALRKRKEDEEMEELQPDQVSKL